MSLAIESVLVPLRVDSDGVARIATTRVTLDAIVRAFRNGASAEEICQRYPSVSLPDAYSVIAFFLQHTTDVERYLGERERLAGTVRRENEARFNPYGVRDRLLARRKSRA